MGICFRCKQEKKIFYETAEDLRNEEQKFTQIELCGECRNTLKTPEEIRLNEERRPTPNMNIRIDRNGILTRRFQSDYNEENSRS